MGAVYLIRHGQASFGAENYDQLSETGYIQARVLGEALKARQTKVDAVITGTLARHQQTAQTCLKALGHDTAPVRIPGFNEFDHVELIVRHTPRYANHAAWMEDLATAPDPHRAIQDMFGQAVARWLAGKHDHEYAESWPAFQQRCIRALDSLIQDLGPSKTALVFTSGGPVTAICQHLLRIPDEYAFRLNWTLANCGITKVVYSDRGPHLSTLNEHSHFEGPHRALVTYR
ncbi:histidine phosphatase family protein [Myxococcus stipitatus]|uniref:histidine phosphatase family protein n=1 Tax=Myxococcus stipitatus TaxID=83455 RepID=UPI0030D39E1B